MLGLAIAALFVTLPRSTNYFSFYGVFSSSTLLPFILGPVIFVYLPPIFLSSFALSSTLSLYGVGLG